MTHLYEAFSGEERSSDRYALSINTTMRALGQENQPLHIANISACGFGGQSPHMFQPPCVVSVKLPGIGEVKARVAWAGSGRVGGQFLVPIDLEALVNAIGK